MSSFRTSNQLSDLLMALLTGDEWKVVYYIIRRTHGLGHPEGNHISLREFADGHFDNGIQKDFGTGLSVPTIEKILTCMRGFGVVKQVTPPDMAKAIAAVYAVQTEPDMIDIDGLRSRAESKAETNRNRTASARAKRYRSEDTPIVGQNSPSIVPQNGSTPLVRQSEPIQSDIIDPFSATENTPVVGLDAYKEGHGLRHGSSQELKAVEKNAPATQGAEQQQPKRKRVSKYYPQIVEVFDYWKKELNHPKAILGEKRRRAVRKRLTEGYTVERLKLAIDGCRASPRFNGQIYDDLEMICSSESTVDRFIGIAEGTIQPNGGANGSGQRNGNLASDRREGTTQAESSPGEAALASQDFGDPARRIGKRPGES